MKIISICATKGGTGKSTLATSLAVHASVSARVALVDFDKQQQSATGWAALRKKNPRLNGPTFFPVEDSLRSALRACRHDRMDYAIVDSPPTLDEDGILEHVVEQADYILSPCRPSVFDVAAARTLAEFADGIQLGFVMVDCDEEWEPSNRKMAKALAGFGFKVFKARLMHRRAYVDNLQRGRTGPETDSDAASEVDALWGEIVAWTK